MPATHLDKQQVISVNGQDYDFKWELHQAQIESILCRNTSEMFEIFCANTEDGTSDALQSAIQQVLSKDQKVNDTLAERRSRINGAAASDPNNVWPDALKPDVQSYTIDQLRAWGIILEPNRITFSWPKNYNQGKILHEACYTARSIPALQSDAYTAGEQLSGRVIANVIKIFNDVILLSLRHYDNTAIHAIYEGLDSLLRISYAQEYARQLPRNLHFEFATEESMYTVQCFEQADAIPGEDHVLWKIILPIKQDLFGDRLAYSPLRYYPSGSEGCDPPCAEADNK